MSATATATMTRSSGHTVHRDENGNAHRIDGPAIETYLGYRQWRIHGLLHRIDGPAVEWQTGYREWHLAGQRVTVDVVVDAWLATTRPNLPEQARTDLILRAERDWTFGQTLADLCTA